MRNFSILFLILSIFLISCSKKNQSPEQSYIKFILGTTSKGTNEHLVPFKNQHIIEFGELDTIDNLRIMIREDNLDIVKEFPPDSGLYFKIDINTNKDKQYCLTEYNCGLIGVGYNSQFSKVFAITCDFEFPIKISNSAISNNDTLELNDSDNFIVISYTSIYSKFSAKDSVLIKKLN